MNISVRESFNYRKRNLEIPTKNEIALFTKICGRMGQITSN